MRAHFFPGKCKINGLEKRFEGKARTVFIEFGTYSPILRGVSLGGPHRKPKFQEAIKIN